MLHSVSVERSEHDRTHMVCLIIKVPYEVIEDSPRNTNLLDHVRGALAGEVVRQVTDQFNNTNWCLDMGVRHRAHLDPPNTADPLDTAAPAIPPDPGRRALDLD